MDILESHLGKMGGVLWSFANGYDETPVRTPEEESPIKSIGNSVTTPRDMLNNEDVKTVLFVLSESVGARLRKHGFRAQTVEIYVRDNELEHFIRQRKLPFSTDSAYEIASAAYSLFTENYQWNRPVRSVGVRGVNLKLAGFAEQLDLFTDDDFRKKMAKADRTVDEIRSHFGYYAVQRGILVRDPGLSHLNAEEDHVSHPVGFIR